jgi:hypothetical protein
MLRHSWATGGASSGRRQQQQQQVAERQQANAPAAAADTTTIAAATSSSSSSSSSVSYLQEELLQVTGSLSSNSNSSSDSVDDDSSSSSDKAQEPAFAGIAAAAGSDWAATAAKAAQLRSVIEWGLEAYGVNAAGSEPSNEVSVVIWPGEGVLLGRWDAGCWVCMTDLRNACMNQCCVSLVVVRMSGCRHECGAVRLNAVLTCACAPVC